MHPPPVPRLIPKPWHALLPAALLLLPPTPTPAQWQKTTAPHAPIAATPHAPTPTPRKVQTASGRSPIQIYREGLLAYQNGNYQQCLADLDEFISQFAAEPELASTLNTVYYARACAAYNLGNHENAIPYFQAYLEKFPDSPYADECHYRIATSYLQLEQIPQAIAAFQLVSDSFPASPYAEDSAYSVAFCHLLQSNNPAAAAAFLAFMERYPASSLWCQAGAFAARATFDMGSPADAIRLLARIESRPMSWSVVSYCNFLAFEIGDALFENTDYLLALKAYRRVKTRDSLLRHQRAYATSLAADLDALRASPAYRKNPRAAFRQERRLASDLQQAREMADRLAKLPNYDVNLYHRIGRCFFNTDQFWEARVAFARVAKIAPDPILREAAHFDLILSISRLHRYDDLLIEADDYLSQYDPTGNWN